MMVMMIKGKKNKKTSLPKSLTVPSRGCFLKRRLIKEKYSYFLNSQQYLFYLFSSLKHRTYWKLIAILILQPVIFIQIESVCLWQLCTNQNPVCQRIEDTESLQSLLFFYNVRFWVQKKGKKEPSLGVFFVCSKQEIWMVYQCYAPASFLMWLTALFMRLRKHCILSQ